jgi:hypothetical protein
MNNNRNNGFLNMNAPAAPIINNVNNALNSLKNTTQNLTSGVTNVASNVANNVANTVTETTGFTGAVPVMLIVLSVLFVATIVIIYFFYDKIRDLIPDSIKMIFGGGDMKPAAAAAAPAPVVKRPPTNVERPEPTPVSSVESILPGKKEVFNVSSNRYTYGDAEPLCRALGAQLATYDQVKAAFDGGADWCNYGWTKGQLAMFPTQKETYDKLQAGPEGQRQACGKVGLNGGYFDNPEMRFGVNCYGMKPSQSKHDAADQSKGIPISPDALDFDKKVSQYKADADNIGILPFRTGAWSS